MKPLLLFIFLFSAKAALTQQVDSLSSKFDTIANTLKTVVVANSKTAIEVQADKTVINLDAQPSAIGENILDVLRRSPGVSVDGADNILLNGKGGVNILIDGKPTQLSPQDLVQLLKSMQAANIRQIELITNPSAKYDAAGNAGIINIKLKKSLTNGFNGNVTGSFVQSNHGRKNVTGNLNWRKDKLAVFFNGSINDGLQHVIANNDRISGNKVFTQRSIEKDFFNGSSIRTGVDYSLNKKSTLGFLWMQNSRNTNLDNGSTTLMQTQNQTDTIYNTRSLIPLGTKRNAYNLNYNFSDQSIEYSVDADYTLHQSSVENLIVNDLRNHQNVKIGGSATNNDQQVKIHLHSVKGDIAKTISPALKFETGFKLMSTRTVNSLGVKNLDGGFWIADTGKSNNFLYKENISALYGSLKGEKKRFSWQLGIRAELTTVKGKLTDLKFSEVNQPDTTYFNLFPTLFFKYKIDGKNQLGFSANRRIDRPNYQDQNPFIYFLDALNTEQGNAYLQPQLTNNLEVSYTYKYATSIKISYAHTSNYIESLTYQDGKYTVQTPQNSGSKKMLSFSFSSPVKFTKMWSAYISLIPYYHFYNIQLNGFGNTEQQQGGSWAFNSFIGNNIDFGKGWKGSFGGWFNFQNRATIYVSKPLGSLDIGMQKNLLRDKATIKLSVVDILNTQQWEQRATTADLWLNTYRKWESQNVTLGFSWRFGNSKIKKVRERAAGSEEDTKRIK